MDLTVNDHLENKIQCFTTSVDRLLEDNVVEVELHSQVVVAVVVAVVVEVGIRNELGVDNYTLEVDWDILVDLDSHEDRNNVVVAPIGIEVVVLVGQVDIEVDIDEVVVDLVVEGHEWIGKIYQKYYSHSHRDVADEIVEVDLGVGSVVDNNHAKTDFELDTNFD